jgi:hypothetical protein
VLKMHTPILNALCIRRVPHALLSARPLATAASQTASTPAVLLSRPTRRGRPHFNSLDTLRGASSTATDDKTSGNVQPGASPPTVARESDAEEEYWVREQVPKPNRTFSFLCRPSAGVRSLLTTSFTVFFSYNLAMCSPYTP